MKLITYRDVNPKMYTKKGVFRKIFYGLTPENSLPFEWNVLIGESEYGKIIRIPIPKTRRKLNSILKTLLKEIRDSLIIDLQIKK